MKSRPRSRGPGRFGYRRLPFFVAFRLLPPFFAAFFLFAMVGFHPPS
ncbi:MAG TPA: hypothetical protein VJA45_02335 [Methylomirabilota bacterium]|nr:hypothetical protein [Methylomirabilota bacterium]